MSRLDPVEAGSDFVAQEFPDARAAFVAGSFRRSEANSTSDLDIVIVADRADAPYRAACHRFGWPIEFYVHTESSLLQFFAADAARLMPSLLAMCSEGAIVADYKGLAGRIQAEARAILDLGPEPLRREQIDARRYGLSDILEDFRGCLDAGEGTFIATELAAHATEMILLHHGCWLGHGKWVLRALRVHDRALAGQLAEALDAYLRESRKEPLIAFAENALRLEGGPLFDGYYQRAPQKPA